MLKGKDIHNVYYYDGIIGIAWFQQISFDDDGRVLYSNIITDRKQQEKKEVGWVKQVHSFTWFF